MPYLESSHFPFFVIHCIHLFWAKDNNQTKRYLKKQKKEKQQAQPIYLKDKQQTRSPEAMKQRHLPRYSFWL